MTIPARPHYQPQVPRGQSNSCVLGGVAFGWTNCTPTSFAMAIEKASLNRTRPTGCNIRTATGDRSGGTTLYQCAAVALGEYGIRTDVHAGAEVTTPVTIARTLRAGRGVVAQGDIGVAVGTPFRSTAGPVAHAIYANEVRGGTIDEPKEVLVYDPAANGRTAGWGTAAQGPAWWPWSLFKKFLAALRPSGPGTPVLGPGKAYAAFFPDTEPHVHLYGGARKTTPFPDGQVFHLPPGETGKIIVRAGPSKDYRVVALHPPGEHVTAYQYKPAGGLDNGSRGWYGNHDGNRWWHESGVVGRGGTS